MEINNDLGTADKKSHGRLTAEIAKTLVFEDYDVLYDHGVSSESVGRIVSYFGDKNERGTQLSYLDIALVKKQTNQVVALIEIEESMDRPKTIIADIFAFLLGDQVTFKGRKLEVGKQTRLLVIGFSKVKQPKHNQHIRKKVEKVKSALGTRNSKIGKVLIETYSDKDKLFSLVTSLLDESYKGQL